MNKLHLNNQHQKIRKEQLIEQATTRLRRKQLEEQVKQMMNNMNQMQYQMDEVYQQMNSMMIQTQHLKDLNVKEQQCQMNLIEKNMKTILNQNDKSSSSSFIQSSLSILSSFFQPPLKQIEYQQDQPMVSRSTSTTLTLVNDNNNDHYILDHQKGYQRRIRIKNHHLKKRKQKKNHLFLDDNDSIITDLSSDTSSLYDEDEINHSSLMKKNHHHHQDYLNKDQHQHWIYDHQPNYQLPLSPPLSPIDMDDDNSSISCINDDDDDDECASTLSSIKSSTSSITSSSIYSNQKKINRLSQRTVLDDTLDFLDQYANEQQTMSTYSMEKKNHSNLNQSIKDDGFDDQFFEDMAFLLDHPEICNRPLADVTPLLKQHQLEQSYSSNISCHSLSLMNHHQIEKHQQPKTKMESIYQWGRFLSVLSATYVVSLLKGPDDLD